MLQVLIVEDEEIIRKGLEVSLDWLSLGCVIAGSARDGKEGLKMILEKSPDIVISDIKMPKMSGIEMLEEAKKEREFYSIILSSYAEFEYAKEAIRLGVLQYLLKPVDEEELKKEILKIAEQIKKHKNYARMEEVFKNKVLRPGDEWTIFARANSNSDVYVQRTYDIIQRKYMEKLSIQSVSWELGISSSYLSRVLKKHLSLGFVDLLNKYRIKQAMSYLDRGEKKIYEIAELVGFTDYKHFCSVFKRYTSLSPSEYQKYKL